MAEEQGGTNDFLINVALKDVTNFNVLLEAMENVRESAKKGAKFKVELDPESLAAMNRQIAEKVQTTVTVDHGEGGGNSATDAANFRVLREAVDALRSSIDTTILSELRAQTAALQGGGRRPKGDGKSYTAPNGATVHDLRPEKPFELDLKPLNDRFIEIADSFSRRMNDAFLQIPKLLDLRGLAEEAERYRRAARFGVSRPVGSFEEALQRYRDPRTPHNERQYLHEFVYEVLSKANLSDKGFAAAQERRDRRRAAFSGTFGKEDVAVGSSRRVLAGSGFTGFRENDVFTTKTGLSAGDLRATQVAITKRLRQEAAQLDAEVATAVRELDSSRRAEIEKLRKQGNEDIAHATAHDNKLTPTERQEFHARGRLKLRSADEVEAEIGDVTNQKNRDLEESGARKKKLAAEKRSAADALDREFNAYLKDFAAILPTRVVAQARTRIRRIATDLEAAIRELKIDPQAFSQKALEEHFSKALDNPLIETVFGAGQQDPRVLQQIRGTDVRLRQAKQDRDDLIAVRDNVSKEGITEREKDLARVRSRIKHTETAETVGGPDPGDVRRVEKLTELIDKTKFVQRNNEQTITQSQEKLAALKPPADENAPEEEVSLYRSRKAQLEADITDSQKVLRQATFNRSRYEEEQAALQKKNAEAPPVTTGPTPEREAMLVKLREEEVRLEKGLAAMRAAIPDPAIVAASIEKVQKLEQELEALTASLKQGFSIDPNDIGAMERTLQRLQTVREALGPAVAFADEFKQTKVPNAPNFNPFEIYSLEKDKTGNVTGVNVDKQMNDQLQHYLKSGGQFQSFGEEQQNVLVNALAFKEGKVRELRRQSGSAADVGALENDIKQITHLMRVGGEYFHAGPQGENRFERFSSLENYLQYSAPHAISEQDLDAAFDRMRKLGVRSPEAGSAFPLGTAPALGGGGAGYGVASAADVTRLAALLGPHGADGVKGLLAAFEGVDLTKQTQGVAEYLQVLTQLARAMDRLTPGTRRVVQAQAKRDDQRVGLDLTKENRADKTKNERDLIVERKTQDRETKLKVATEKGVQQQETARVKAAEQRDTDAARFEQKSRLQATAQRFRRLFGGLNPTAIAQSLFGYGIVTGDHGAPDRDQAGIIKGMNDSLRKIAVGQEAFEQNKARIRVLGPDGNTTREERAITEAEKNIGASTLRYIDFGRQAGRNPGLHDLFTEFDAYSARGELRNRAGEQLPAGEPLLGSNGLIERLDAIRSRRESLRNDYERVNRIGLDLQDPEVIKDPERRKDLRQDLVDTRRRLEKAGFVSERNPNGTLAIDPQTGERITGTKKLEQALINLKLAEDAVAAAATHTGKTYLDLAQPTKEALTNVERFAGKVKQLATYMGAGFLLYGAVNQIHRFVNEVADLESELARIQGVLESRSLGDRLKIEQGIIDSAEKYGQKIKDVANIAKTFAQTGLSPRETIRETQAALAGVQGAGLEPQQTVETLVATRNISGGQVSPENILDRISRVEARNAVTANDLSIAIQRVGSFAQQLQPNQVGSLDAFDTVIGAVTQIVEETRVTGSQAATSLRFILARLTSPEVGSQLQGKYGIKLAANEQGTELRPLVDILEDISRKFKELSNPNQPGGPRSIEAAQLLQTVAGNRQVNAAAALFGDFDKVLKTAEESAFAFGDTQARLAIQQDTLRFKLDRLGATALDLANAFLTNTGALGGLKLIVDGLAGSFKFLSGRDFQNSGYGNVVSGILPGLTAAVSTYGALRLGGLAGRSGRSLVAGAAEGTLARELGGILSVVAKLNPVLRILLGIFTALTLTGALTQLLDLGKKLVGYKEDAFKKIDPSDIRDSYLGKQFTQRATALGQTPESLFRATTDAVRQATEDVQRDHPNLNLFTLDRKSRQYQAGVADEIQTKFVDYLSKSVPALADMTDKAEQTAEAMRVLKESAQYSSAALGQRRTEFNTRLSDVQNNLADRLQENSSFHVPTSVLDYVTPRFKGDEPAGLVGRSFSYNSVVATARGADSEDRIRQDVDSIIRKVFGELGDVTKNLTIFDGGKARQFDVELARMINTARQQGDASLTLGRAMDQLANRYLTLSREQENLIEESRKAVLPTLPKNAPEQQIRDAITGNLRTRGPFGNATADTYQTTNQARDQIFTQLADNLQLEKNISDTKGVSGELTQFGRAGGGAISKAMLDIVIKASQDLATQLETRGQTGESKAMREFLLALEASDNRDKFLANVAKSVRQRPGRDELLAVVSRFAQQREEIGTAQRLFGAAGIGIDAQQERVAAAQQAIRGVGGVRAKLEGELFQLFQKRGEISEVGKSLNTLLGQPDQTTGEDENARLAAAKNVRAAFGRTVAGISPEEIDKLDRSIGFVTDALGDIEKNNQLFDKLPDELRARIDNALKSGDVVARVETFRDVEAALVNIAAQEEKLLRVRERAFEVLQVGQQLESERADRQNDFNNILAESRITSLESVGGPQAGLLARFEQILTQEDISVQRARRESAQGKETLTKQRDAGLVGDQDFLTKSLLIDLKRINSEEVAALERRNKEVELLENARNDLLRDTMASTDNLSRQALSGLRDVLGGGYNSFRGDREGRQGPVGRDVVQRVVEPFARSISERLADNFIETLVGQNGILGLRTLLGNNLLTEQQLLQRHRALELVNIKEGAREGVLEGLQAQRLQATKALDAPSLKAERQLKGVPVKKEEKADFSDVPKVPASTTAPGPGGAVIKSSGEIKPPVTSARSPFEYYNEPDQLLADVPYAKLRALIEKQLVPGTASKLAGLAPVALPDAGALDISAPAVRDLIGRVAAGGAALGGEAPATVPEAAVPEVSRPLVVAIKELREAAQRLTGVVAELPQVSRGEVVAISPSGARGTPRLAGVPGTTLPEPTVPELDRARASAVISGGRLSPASRLTGVGGVTVPNGESIDVGGFTLRAIEEQRRQAAEHLAGAAGADLPTPEVPLLDRPTLEAYKNAGLNGPLQTIRAALGSSQLPSSLPDDVDRTYSLADISAARTPQARDRLRNIRLRAGLPKLPKPVSDETVVAKPDSANRGGPLLNLPVDSPLRKPGTPSPLSPQQTEERFSDNYIAFLKSIKSKIKIPRNGFFVQNGVLEPIYREAVRQGVDPNYALAVAWRESAFNPKAEGDADELGLFQLKRSTAKVMGLQDPEQLRDPNVAAKYGIKYLRERLERFGGNPAIASAAFNAGDKYADNFGANFDEYPWPHKTYQYVRSILGVSGNETQYRYHPFTDDQESFVEKRRREIFKLLNPAGRQPTDDERRQAGVLYNDVARLRDERRARFGTISANSSQEQSLGSGAGPGLHPDMTRKEALEYDYQRSLARLRDLTNSPFADTMFQVAGRPAQFGLVGGRSHTSVEEQQVKGRYTWGDAFGNRTDLLELAPFELRQVDNKNRKVDPNKIGHYPKLGEFNIDQVFAHEMGHRLDKTVSGPLRSAVDAARKGKHADDNYYANENPDDYFAEAFSAAVQSLRVTQQEKDPTKIAARFQHTEDLIPGSNLLAQYLLSQPIYSKHPAKKVVGSGDLDKLHGLGLNVKLPGALVTGTHRGRILRGPRSAQFAALEEGIGPVPNPVIPQIPDIEFPSTISQLLRNATITPDLVGLRDFKAAGVPNTRAALTVDEGAGINGVGLLNPKGIDLDAIKKLQDQKNLQTQLRAQNLQKFEFTASAMAGQLLGGYFGGTKGGVNHGFNYGSEGATLGSSLLPGAVGGLGSLLGSSLGAVGTIFAGPLGPLIGGVLGGLLGGLFKKKQEKPVEYAQAERIEHNTRQTVTAIENQSRSLFSLDQRLFNVPASFQVPQYRPLTGGAGLGVTNTGDTYYNIDVHVPVQNNADHDAIAGAVTDKLKRELGLTGRHVSEKY